MRKWNTRCTLQQYLPFTVLKLDVERMSLRKYFWLRQHLLFTVCAAECEAAEERSGDEAHTLQVPERSEGKTREIRKALTVYGIETQR